MPLIMLIYFYNHDAMNYFWAIVCYLIFNAMVNSIDHSGRR